MKMRILLMIALMISLAQNAFAAEYYMSPFGNDSNPGTLAAPWKTMDRLQVAQAILRPGDTVWFRGGDYMLTDSDVNGRYRVLVANVTYKNYSGEVPVIVWDRVVRRTTHNWMLWLNADSITIDGLNFRVTERSRSFGQLPNNGENIKGNGVVPGGLVTWQSNGKIRNCSIENFSVGVGVYGGSNLLVENCKVSGTISHGFYISAGSGTYRYNSLNGSRAYWNQREIQVQYRLSSRNKIYGNFIANGQAAAVVFSDGCSGNEFFNNIILNGGSKKETGHGLYGYPLDFNCGNSPNGGPLMGPGNKAYNNTIIGKSNSGLIAPWWSECGGNRVEIFNNIFYPSSAVPVVQTGSNIHDNIFYNITGSVPGGNTMVNPNLVTPNGSTSADAMLQAGSPARGRGGGCRRV
ncbi:MAG: right-handed parallel beta-helix repeat-containing protein [Candidatus Omnitrophica bacterium]|nr:right-handed parallel beta-helix repeat-containing protein [Candidatus Omnitrophota bacterium]